MEYSISVQELVTFKESLETTVKVKEEENADVKHKLESLEEQHKTALSELQEQLESSARAHRLAVQEHQDRISHLERQLEESKEAERLGKVSLGKKNETIVEMQESIDLLETRIASVSLKEKVFYLVLWLIFGATECRFLVRGSSRHY